MSRFIRLSILPAIGLLFLTAAYLWSQRELNLRFFGRPAEGRLIGMVLQRADHADVLAAIDTELSFTLANGDRIDASYINFALTNASYRAVTDAVPRALAADDLQSSDFPGGISPELRRVINEAVRGDAAILRWALLRESRRPDDPLRVLRIEKTETIHGYFGVTKVPEVFGLHDGRLFIAGDDASSPQAGTARIHAVFDRGNLASVKANKGETLIEYSYNRLGEDYSPEKKDFFLKAEPYSTQFRPVFMFEANGRSVARLSHIGRHGGPTLALALYGPCRVYYDQKNPEQAMVTALPGPIAGAPLEWFSRLCEGIFAQWGSTALIALAGCMFISVGLIFVSLAVLPSRNKS